MWLKRRTHGGERAVRIKVPVIGVSATEHVVMREQEEQLTHRIHHTQVRATKPASLISSNNIVNHTKNWWLYCDELVREYPSALKHTENIIRPFSGCESVTKYMFSLTKSRWESGIFAQLLPQISHVGTFSLIVPLQSWSLWNKPFAHWRWEPLNSRQHVWADGSAHAQTSLTQREIWKKPF